jgi:hypothetical protein
MQEMLLAQQQSMSFNRPNNRQVVLKQLRPLSGQQ